MSLAPKNAKLDPCPGAVHRPPMNPISSEQAPAAIGPYSQAMRTGNWIFTSGQIPVDPDSGAIVEGDVSAQVHQVLKNLTAVLAAEGLSLKSVVKTTVFLTDLGDFQVLNGIYAEYFGSHKPARSTIQVAALPLGSLVEIECVAEVSG
ncbi:MAG: RidA family protein [Verrucomicrobiales bacterium]